MRHTLHEFLMHYDVDAIQLRFANHLVSIDIDSDGSYAIIKAFEDYKFDFLNYDKKSKFLLLVY